MRRLYAPLDHRLGGADRAAGRRGGAAGAARPWRLDRHGEPDQHHRDDRTVPRRARRARLEVPASADRYAARHRAHHAAGDAHPMMVRSDAATATAETTRIPLLTRTRDATIAWHDGRPVTVAALLGDAGALARRLPERGALINACANRY